MKKVFLRMITILLMITLACGTVMLANAEQANKNVLIGDANKDLEVSVLDATTIQKYMVKDLSQSRIDMVSADVNLDKDINIIDATLIQSFLAQLIALPANKEPIETDIAYEEELSIGGEKYKYEHYTNGDYKKYIWIIDVQATEEEIPIYESSNCAVCNKCGKVLSSKTVSGVIEDENSPYYGWSTYKYHSLIEKCNSGWHIEYDVDELVGYETTQIPEQGHWELLN